MATGTISGMMTTGTISGTIFTANANSFLRKRQRLERCLTVRGSMRGMNG